MNSKKKRRTFRRFGYAVFLIMTILLLPGCTKKVDSISAKEISSISLTKLETGKTIVCGQSEIYAFAAAYNRATYFRDDWGTTDPLHADVIFADGTAMRVWGGAQSYQTVQINGEQHNIKSRKLEQWFDRAG